MEIDYVIKALKKFNRRATELENSEFFKKLAPSGVRSKFSFKERKAKIERFGPSRDYYISASSMIRFFILDDEGCSFKVLGEMYENLTIPEDKKILFINARKEFNKLLDTKSIFTVKDTTPTNREILEAFIHGHIFHENEKRNPEKVELYNSLMDNILSVPFSENEFVFILGSLAKIISSVKILNEEVIKELEDTNLKN